MSSSDLAITIQGVSKAYTIAHGALKRPSFREVAMERLRRPFHRRRTETFWALKDVSFDVKKGEVVGIIGRNGAGKSTLFKILSRITEPTAGRIELYGRVGSLLEVGTGFHPELTGRENVFLNGAILGMSRAEIRKQFDAIVDFAEIEKFIDTPVKRYSSGMYVRLAFAVAAHLNPEILIVDEVLAVGDAQFQKKCLGKMSEVAHGGRTILFVSHNMSAITVLCGRCVVLAGGRLSFTGTPQDCIREYMDTTEHETQRILDRMEVLEPSLSLTSVTVNGSSQSALSLLGCDDQLAFEVTGSTRRPLRLGLEVKFYDLNRVPLAVFSPAHDRGQTPVTGAGPFAVRHVVRLPRLCKGSFIADIDLIDPEVRWLAKGPHAITLRVAGSPTMTGRVFEYANNGWVHLPEMI